MLSPPLSPLQICSHRQSKRLISAKGLGKDCCTEALPCEPSQPYPYTLDVAAAIPSESKRLQAGKNYFRIIFGALQENPVIAPGAIAGGALTGHGAHTGDYFGGNSFRGLYRKIL